MAFASTSIANCSIPLAEKDCPPVLRSETQTDTLLEHRMPAFPDVWHVNQFAI